MDMSFHRSRVAPPPRLQIFVNDLGATGVVRNAIAIANQAAASGFDVRVLTCRADGVLRGELDARIDVVELLRPEGARLKRSAELRSAWAAYRRETRRWRPDILLSAGNHGHLLSTLAWLGLPGAKVLRISNDLGHKLSDGDALKRIWRAVKLRLAFGLADRLVLVSHGLCAHPRMRRHIESGKALLIPNGVDVGAVTAMAGEICPHPWLSEPRVPVVLAVGRPAPQKNLPTLLKAFARARERRDLRLVILGGTPGRELEALARIASDLGVGPNVDLVPAVPNPFSYMAAADVLALPSLWEGSSNVLLEAMACGTPVVAATSAGDARVVLDKGRFGLLVEPLDEAALADALLSQTGARPILPADRARDFDRGRALAAYMQLFNQLAGAPRRKSIESVPDQPAARKLAAAR